MKITLDGKLTISNLTVAERNFIKSENEWPNPEIQAAEKMGRFTGYMPALVYAWEEQANGDLVVSRGYLDRLLTVAAPSNTQDNRTTAPLDMPQIEEITYRDYQLEVLDQAYQNEQGLLIAPTGSGKTIIGMAIMAHHGQRSLILTHSRELANQWGEEIKKWMGVDAGFIGGGKWCEGKEVTIAMLQTLYKNPQKALTMAQGYGLTIIEECHHTPANTFTDVINWVPTLYRYGLTATPHRRDGLHDLIYRSIGEVLATIDPDQVELEGGIVPATIKTIYTGFTPAAAYSWADYVTELTLDKDRNRHIAETAENAAKEAPVLILTDRIQHVEAIGLYLVTDHLQIHGKLKTKERAERMEAIDQHQITVGTTGLLGEGLDFSKWGVLILATPISSKVRLLQAVGRVIRPHEGKERGYVADFVDNCGFSIASHKKRLQIYLERGFRLAA